MADPIPFEQVRDDNITYTVNDETTWENSDDFEALDGFSDLLSESINSGGEIETFQSNMKKLASMVTAGSYTVGWITCEDEGDRIDLHITPGRVMCTVHLEAVDDLD